MIHNLIGLPDHVLIILQKLTNFASESLLVMVSMDEFVHAPIWS